MKFLPSDIVMIALVLAGILGLMWTVRLLSRRFALTPEVQRKLIHVATGGASLLFPVFFSGAIPVFILFAFAIVLMFLLRIGNIKNKYLGSVLHNVQRDSYGEIYLIIAIAFLFFRSQGTPVLYVLPLLVVTLSDTTSALVGTSYGRKRFAIEGGHKSVEGVVAFFVVAWLITLITLLLMTDMKRMNVIVLSFLISAFCALVEADSWKGLDNLFVPVGAHLFLEKHLASSTTELFLISAGFVMSLAAMRVFAPALKLSAHTARAYMILLFLVLSVTAPHNAIFPIFAILMHIVARALRPCCSERPDLDLIVVSASVGLFWLFFGEFLERSAINLFNLTFAAAATAFAGLSVTTAWRVIAVPVTVFIGLTYSLVSSMNPPDAILFGTGWLPIFLVLSIPFVITLWAPRWFSTHRSVKTFALALIAPVGTYVKEGILG